jgi:hypothetical protein
MNQHEAMMKSNGNLIWRVCLMLEPIAYVIEELPQFSRDSRRVDTNVLACRTVLPCPTPSRAEHPSMQIQDEPLVQQPSPP